MLKDAVSAARILTPLALVALLLLIFLVDPFEGQTLTLFLLLLSLGIFLAGGFVLLPVFFRRKALFGPAYLRRVIIAVLLLMILLWLQALRVLVGWNLLALALLAVSLEFYFGVQVNE